MILNLKTLTQSYRIIDWKKNLLILFISEEFNIKVVGHIWIFPMLVPVAQRVTCRPANLPASCLVWSWAQAAFKQELVHSGQKTKEPFFDRFWSCLLLTIEKPHFSNFESLRRNNFCTCLIFNPRPAFFQLAMRCFKSSLRLSLLILLPLRSVI